MKNSNIDKLANDIMKNSYLEITDPDFNGTIMKRVLQESRKQRVLENIFLCVLVFVAVDSLIFLVLWLFGLNIFDVALRSENISQELLLHIDKFKDAILQNGFIKYIFLLFGLIAFVEWLTESNLKILRRPK